MIEFGGHGVLFQLHVTHKLFQDNRFVLIFGVVLCNLKMIFQELKSFPRKNPRQPLLNFTSVLGWSLTGVSKRWVSCAEKMKWMFFL